MKRKLLILFFIIITVLAAFSLYQRHLKWAFSRPVKERSAFPDFRPEDVHSFTIKWRDSESNLAFVNGIWTVRERDNAQAQTSKVVEFLNALFTITPLKELENCDEEALQTLRLVEKTPDPADIPGLLVTLRDKFDNKIFELVLGKGHYTRQTLQLTGYEAEAASGRYILLRREGHPDRVFLISRIFENVQPSPASWLEPLRVYDIMSALSLSVSTLDEQNNQIVDWRIAREPSAPQFKLIKPANSRIEVQTLSSILETLAKPLSRDVLLVPPEKFEPTVFLDIPLMNGITYILSVQPFENNSITHVVLRFDPKKIARHPAESDEQYEQRCVIHAGRAKYEINAFSGKFFITAKDLPDFLERAPVAHAVRTR